MILMIFALFIATQSAQRPAQDDIKVGLAEAEKLYYEARFNESIKVLSNLSEILETRPDRRQDKIATKLQLALANIGLNDTTTAMALLAEVYEMDPDYVLDSKQYSPKVVALANDAKNEQRQIQCQKAQINARINVANRDGAALVELLGSTKGKCPDLAKFEPDAADIIYKQGLEKYRQGNITAALQDFRTVLRVLPSHELAIQYRELTESKLQVAGERLLISWQKNFDAGNYKDAATDYRAIQSQGEFNNPAALTHATAQYRKALLVLVDNWGQACDTGDESAIRNVQYQVTALLPDPSFGGDLRAKMTPCPPVERKPPEVSQIATKTAPPAASSAAKPANRIVDTKPKPAVATPRTCFQMEPQVAMTRLKNRVDPTVPREVLAFIRNKQVTVHVKVRINEEGNVTVVNTTGENVILNKSVSAAVEQWNFSPARDEQGPRCVETELPVSVRG